MNLSVVVPVYRGVGTLDALTEALADVLPRVAASYELLLVDDGSPDASWEAIERLAQRYPWVRGLALVRNRGQENAVLCGLREARYDVVVTMDDDLQHDPKDIPALLARLDEGCDVVYAVLRRRRQIWWKVVLAAVVKNAVAWIIGNPTARHLSSFRALRTRLRDSFQEFRGPDVLVDVLLSWGTNRFGAVEVEESARAEGTSNYNFFKLVRVSLLILTSYTTAPLRFASIVGIAFTLLGLGILIYVLGVYFTLGSVPGFTFLASAIVIFSGVQLFSLGLIGEYLARVFEQTGGRGPYGIGRRTPEGGRP